MLAEHGEIRTALTTLAATAHEQGLPQYARLADKIMLHAATEEQVTYPTALIVGDYVRMRLDDAE